MTTSSYAPNSAKFYSVSSLTRLLIVGLILLLAGGLRFYQLSGQSLWADEGNSVALARRSFVEIARRTAFDIHPPFYYWLLKLWIAVFGESEIGLRALSAVLGILLVYLIWALGRRLFHQPIGLIAAFIAALSPLQIYYSQETRMYMLLTVLSSLTVLATLHIFADYATGHRHLITSLIYILTVTAGLYTHYAYPLILLTVNLAALIYFWQNRHVPSSPLTTYNSKLKTQNSSLIVHHSSLIHWLALQIIPLLLYLPWLPTAWQQLTTWPTAEQSETWLTRLETISTTLLFGHSWPFEGGILAVAILSFTLAATIWLSLTQRLKPSFAPRSPLLAPCSLPLLSLSLLWLWLLLPVTFTALIFSPAFLKFLLVATPPLALLLALLINWLTYRVAIRKITSLGDRITQSFTKPTQRRTKMNLRKTRRNSVSALRALCSYFSLSVVNRQAFLTPGPTRSSRPTVTGYLLSGALLAFVVAGSIIALYNYYTNPRFARDNYRAIVNFIQAVGGPADAVILTAEGQQDVFNYYYQRTATPEVPVFPLPRRRPLDETATLTELAQIEANAANVYAVYWATEQADPTGLIEGWLANHLFKATDRWYGNVRLVSYASPRSRAGLDFSPVDYQFGEQIRLTGYALSNSRIIPGDILQVVLTWVTGSPLPENYTVFVQLLDPANHLVGQRDAQPLAPTTTWPANEPVIDQHGVFIEPGTPPGQHRLIVGLYNSQTGQRLPVSAGKPTGEAASRDFIELAEVEVVRPERPLPPAAYQIQTTVNAAMPAVTLLGYDLYKLGHRSSPETPLQPGDALQLVAYWQLNRPTTGLEDQLIIQLVSAIGDKELSSFSRPVAGTAYPIDQWQNGEIVRAQYELILDNLEPGSYRLALTIGVKQNEESPPTVFTRPFRVR